MNQRIALLLLSESYSEMVGISEARISTLIFNHGARIKRIREGAGLTVASAEKAVKWFSDHWPATLDWPTDIPRPTPSLDSTAAEAVEICNSASELQISDPHLALRADGRIANPTALCEALDVPRYVYDQVIRQYADGRPRADKYPRRVSFGSPTAQMLDALMRSGDVRFARRRERAAHSARVVSDLSVALAARFSQPHSQDPPQ